MISMELIWVRFVSIVSIAFVVVGMYYWGLSLDVVLGCATLILVIFIILALSLNISPRLSAMNARLSSMDTRLSSIDDSLKDIREILGGKREHGTKDTCGRHNPAPEKEVEEKIITSGGGALLGLSVGALIGLIGGPIGVIVGALIGSLVGDLLEYSDIKAEREKKGQRYRDEKA